MAPRKTEEDGPDDEGAADRFGWRDGDTIPLDEDEMAESPTEDAPD